MSELMGDRLGEIIHHYRLTMNSFAKKLGLSSNTVITKAPGTEVLGSGVHVHFTCNCHLFAVKNVTFQT